MSIGVTLIHHIQLFVPKSVEAEAKRFYGELLGLKEIPKAEFYQPRGGAWYQHGDQQIHLSVRDHESPTNAESRRHVCYFVADLGHAERVLRDAGVPIIPDEEPYVPWIRFYARDPGGNLIEVAQLTE